MKVINLAVPSDVRDILDVFVILNLASIANNQQIVNVPLGLDDFINSEVVNNVNRINISSDLRQLLENYVLVNQVIEGVPLL
ncbi:hypothetical protein [Anaerosinus massiliensis]|uniref:hypothetical protein n=1 Tax=Massilibacillus massiliensis TaxID=1806837 RepID=UPI000DA5F04D|nr:hypothetical protein [Massilibacillus massiliensis]